MTLERKTDQQQAREYLSVPRDALLKYLKEGTLDRGYKEGNIPYVLELVVRDMTLQAGYTEFALGCLGGTGHTDLVKSRGSPQKPVERFTVNLYVPGNGLKVGHYDGVKTVRWIAKTQPPDLPEGQDSLRDSVLERLNQFDTLREDLRRSGKRWYSLQSWRFHLDGSMDYWLNPMNQRLYSAGFYSQDDLRSWLNDNPESPVLRANQDKLKQLESGGARKTYKDYYTEGLDKLAGGGETNSRLLTIALMRCPFPDLVVRYLPEG